MAAKKSKKYKNAAAGKRLLYDARGERIGQSPLDNKYLRILLFIVAPYLVINFIIFLLVCSGPRITIEVGDTFDYLSADVDITIKSLLPIKTVEIVQESEELEYERSGNNYPITVTSNGSLTVRAASINGMTAFAYSDISVLDDTAPNVDEASAVITDGKLSFTIADTQSGVDFDSIYGLVNLKETIYPENVDRELGVVTMPIPSDTEIIELHFSDMVGNSRAGTITVTLEGVETEQEEDSYES